jgi:hypothetical protein
VEECLVLPPAGAEHAAMDDSFRSTWTAQCEAAEKIREDWGLEKAIGYLIGEKFISALRMAGDPEVAAEIPGFAARIRELFDPYELSAWFDSVRRIGPLGHTASEEEYATMVAAGALSNNPVTGAEDILLMERVRELLLDR